MMLTQVLMALHKSQDHQYIEALLAQILVVIYQKTHNLPTWQMLKDGMSVFNEESGELMFSILARCSLGDSGKNSFEYMNKMYSMIHMYRSVDDDIRNDMHRAGPKRNWRLKITVDDEGLDATRGWLRGYIRKLKGNTMTFYDGLPEGFKNSAYAAKHQIPLDKHLTGETAKLPMFDPDRQRKELPTRLSRVANKYCVKAWAAENMGDIWPEFFPARKPASDDSDGQDDCISKDAEEDWAVESGDEEDEEDETVPVLAPDTFEADGDADQAIMALAAYGGPDDIDGLAEVEHKHDSQNEGLTEDEGVDVVSDVGNSGDDSKSPPRHIGGKSKDYDEKGQPVSWDPKKWGGVHAGNIRSGDRRQRQAQAKRNISDMAPYVDHSVLDKYVSPYTQKKKPRRKAKPKK